MSRGGHNWKGSGTVEGTRSPDVMKLARSGCLSRRSLGTCQWSNRDGTAASIQIIGGRDAVTLVYRYQVDGEDWQSVDQRVPIRWTLCRLGGERPWFVCDVRSNGVYCGRQVAKLYGAGVCLRAATATGWDTGCSVADRWTALITTLRGCTASSARTITDRMSSRHRNPSALRCC